MFTFSKYLQLHRVLTHQAIEFSLGANYESLVSHPRGPSGSRAGHDQLQLTACDYSTHRSLHGKGSFQLTKRGLYDSSNVGNLEGDLGATPAKQEQEALQ